MQGQASGQSSDYKRLLKHQMTSSESMFDVVGDESKDSSDIVHSERNTVESVKDDPTACSPQSCHPISRDETHSTSRDEAAAQDKDSVDKIAQTMLWNTPVTDEGRVQQGDTDNEKQKPQLTDSVNDIVQSMLWNKPVTDIEENESGEEVTHGDIQRVRVADTVQFCMIGATVPLNVRDSLGDIVPVCCCFVKSVVESIE